MTERPASDGREGYGAHLDKVDVCDDGKISSLTLICHSKGLLGIEWRRAGACPCRSIGLSPVSAAGQSPPILLLGGNIQRSETKGGRDQAPPCQIFLHRLILHSCISAFCTTRYFPFRPSIRWLIRSPELWINWSMDWYSTG